MSSVQVEPIATDSKEIAFQEASLDIWDKKYRLKSKSGDVVDETMDDTYQRVARALADVEAEGDRYDALLFSTYLYSTTYVGLQLAPRRAVLHAFSHEAAFAAACLARGFWLGIGGILTYPRSSLAEVLREVPVTRILLETDCPFLSPEPLRGKDNEPAYIVHTARKVAEVRGVALSEVARTTTTNAIRLFGLPKGLADS